jgi:hypothetical protein
MAMPAAASSASQKKGPPGSPRSPGGFGIQRRAPIERPPSRRAIEGSGFTMAENKKPQAEAWGENADFR